MDYEQSLEKEGRVNVSVDDVVEIDKLYGPLVFMPIRVRLDFSNCEWIVERADAGTDWREVARIPGQLETDFPHGGQAMAQ